jgi:hypothetical protein
MEAQITGHAAHSGRTLQARVTRTSPVMPVAVAASAIAPSIAHERRMSRARARRSGRGFEGGRDHREGRKQAERPGS